MHIVTKFLVVLAAVFGIALSSLTISFAVSNRAILEDYTNVQTELDTLRDSSSAREAQWQNEKGVLERQVADARAQVNAREAELLRLRGEVGELRRGKLAAEQQATTLQNQIAQLNETNRMLTELTDRHSQEVAQLRDRELDLRQNEIALADRIADLRSSNETLQATVRSLQEQMARLEAGEGQAVAGVAATNPDVNRFVRGTITQTQRDASGALLARVDLGTQDGLAPGKRLYILREQGGQPRLVGDFNVEYADLQFADGVIDTKGLGLTPREGDIVVSALRR